MPMGKMFLAQKGKYTRKRLKTGKPTVVRLQKQLNTVRRRIKKEPIVGDANVSGTLNATPVVYHVEPDASSVVNPTGKQMIVKSLVIKGWFKAGSAVPENVMFDVVLDRYPTPGTIATVAQIYEGNIYEGPIIDRANANRFKLLRSVRAYVNTADNGFYFFKMFIKLNFKIKSDSGADYTQAHQLNNALLIVHATQATANQPTYNYHWQSYCVDDN